MWVGGSPGLDDKYLLVIAATWQSIVWSNIANQVVPSLAIVWQQCKYFTRSAQYSSETLGRQMISKLIQINILLSL